MRHAPLTALPPHPPAPPPLPPPSCPPPLPPPPQAHYRDHGKYHFARSVLVLHNVAHQGRGPMDDLRLLEVPDHYRELFRCVWTYVCVQACAWGVGGGGVWVV